MARAGTSITIGPQGRVVIPATLRKLLGLRTGETLLVRAQGGSLVLERREAVLARLKSSFDAVPPEESLVDELLAERRAEAEREERE